MVPSIVRNQSEIHILYRNLAISSLIQYLRRCLDSLHCESRSTLGLGILNSVVVNERESRLLAAHHCTEHRLTSIVSSLSTINQRTTLHCYLATIISHLAIGYNGTNWHIEMDANDITLLDVLHWQITLIGYQVSFHSLAIHGHAISWFLSITISIEVTWHYLVANPSRNTYQEVGILRSTLLHSNLDVSIPRILGCLLQDHILATHLDGRSIACEEVHIDIIVLHTKEITRNGRDETAQVARTAGTTEPWLTCGIAIGIKLVFAIAR